MYANFCFGTPVLFMRAWACVALSGWRVKNYCQDNTRKSLGPVVYRLHVSGKIQVNLARGCV